MNDINKVANVIGFQYWENGIESGYGSVQRLFGKASMSVSECNEEGFSEGAGMTFVFETSPAKGNIDRFKKEETC